MRGPSSVVRQVQAPYVPDIAALDRPDLPVLDIGCGRGEFLKLLREAGIEARGVDLNELFVEECRADGFEMAFSDAISHLRTLEPESLRAVTAFHVVEHMPMPAVEEFLDLARRRHRSRRRDRPRDARSREPRGRRPSLLARPDPPPPDPVDAPRLPGPRAGFEEVEVRRLHPLPPAVEPASGLDPTTERLVSVVNEALTGPLDYMVLGPPSLSHGECGERVRGRVSHTKRGGREERARGAVRSRATFVPRLRARCGAHGARLDPTFAEP